MVFSGRVIQTTVRPWTLREFPNSPVLEPRGRWCTSGAQNPGVPIGSCSWNFWVGKKWLVKNHGEGNFWVNDFFFQLVGWVNSRLENLQLKDEKIRNWMSVNMYYFIYKHVEISMGDLAQKTSSENKWSQIWHDFHTVEPLAFTCVALRKCHIPTWKMSSVCKWFKKWTNLCTRLIHKIHRFSSYHTISQDFYTSFGRWSLDFWTIKCSKHTASPQSYARKTQKWLFHPDSGEWIIPATASLWSGRHYEPCNVTSQWLLLKLL